MLIAIASLKASPGATTAALALAALWPGGQRVLAIEADPAGGDLAARFGLDPVPSLVSLSAAARRDHRAQVAFEHAQQLPGGLPVICAPAAAEQATSALELLTGDGRELWASLAQDPDVVAVVDCGRLDPGSHSHRILAAADIALLVARPTLDECDRLAKSLDGLALRAEATKTELGLVLCGPGFDREQVQENMRMRVWAQLPYDRKGAAWLGGVAGKRGRLASLALPKAARELGNEIAAHYGRAALELEPTSSAESERPAEHTVRSAA
jgi:cellulose biosynthesis protein BcsQ